MEATNCSSLNLLMAKTLADDDFFVHKETLKKNVDKENELSSIDQTLLCASTKKQFNSTFSNSVDKSLPRRGLREVISSSPNLNCTLTGKNTISSSNAQASSEQWTKTRFTVHNDDFSKVKEKSLKPSSIVEKSRKTSGNCSEQEKSSSGEKNNVPLNEKSQESTVMELLNVPNVPNPAITPENLVPTQRINLPPINHQVHKKARKSPKSVYDTLSLELAYNFEYMEEYINFQASISQDKKALSHCFLKKVSCDERRLIVKYLSEFTISLEYPSFILYQAVKIFDSHIDKVEVNKLDLKPLALAALWIAIKKDITSAFEIPEASKIMRLDESAFPDKNESLFKYERAILEALNFEISFAEPSSMLALFTVMIEEVRDLEPSKVEALYYCGCYMIDLSLLHHKLHNIDAITLAVISAEISLAIVMELDETKLSTWSHWRQKLFAANPVLEKYRSSNEKMTHIRDQLLQTVIISKDEKTDYHVVYKKYSKTRYGQVSDLIVRTYFSTCIKNWSAGSDFSVSPLDRTVGMN